MVFPEKLRKKMQAVEENQPGFDWHLAKDFNRSPETTNRAS